MPWQDFVIGTGSIVFIIALIPTLLSKDKPRWETALLTASMLYLFAGTYTTIDLWFSAITAAITASMWMAIAIPAWQNQTNEDWYGEKTEKTTR